MAALPGGDERPRNHLHVVVRVVVAKPKRGGADGGSEWSQQIVMPIGDGIALPRVAQLRLEVTGPSDLSEPGAIELVDRRCVQPPWQVMEYHEALDRRGEDVDLLEKGLGCTLPE